VCDVLHHVQCLCDDKAKKELFVELTMKQKKEKKKKTREKSEGKEEQKRRQQQ